jgi:hypothetical protein
VIVPLDVRAAAELELRRRRIEAPLWTPNDGPQTEAYYCTADELFYGGSAGGGKLLALDTPIPTPEGWKVMGDLQPGDHVFDACGTIIDVIAAYPIDVNPECFLLTFDDGSQIKAGAEHRWLTYDARELSAFTASIAKRNSEKPSTVKPIPIGTIRTTREISETLRLKTGRANHAIPLTAALYTQEIALPIDPYCLGAWLGDGSAACGGVTGIDPEIWQEIERAGFKVSHHTFSEQSHSILELKPLLRQIGVLQNKHIPTMYSRASRSQRLALLQGLMDTDGTVSGSGSVEFTNTNRRLAEGVYEIIVSLGWKCRIVESRAMLYGKDCGPVFNIKWTPDDYVFRLPRKRSKQKLATRRTTKFRYIVGCEPIPSEPMRCITVSSANGLYLAGRSMIPTHNSDLALGLALTQHRKSIIFRRIYKNLRALIDRCIEIVGHNNGLNQSLYVWRNLPGNRSIEFGAMEQTYDKINYKGNPHDLYVFDEAPDFIEEQVTFVTAWARTTLPNQRVRIVYTGNPPTNTEGEWIIRRFAAWLDAQHPHPAQPGELRWYASIDGKEKEVESGDHFMYKNEMVQPKSRTFIPAKLSDNPYLKDTPYGSVLQSLPEPLRSQLLYGDFNIRATDDIWQAIPTEWVRLAQARWEQLEAPDYAMTECGVDVARGGDDKTVLACLYGEWFDELKSYPGKTTPNGDIVAQYVIQEVPYDASVAVDVVGVGASAYDALKRMNVYQRLIAVNNGAGSNAKDKSNKFGFANVRAASYWQFREALDPASEYQIALPPDRELLADLCSAKYRLTGARYQIEPKEDIKKRIGRSPDKADAVVMAWWAKRAVPKWEAFLA